MSDDVMTEAKTPGRLGRIYQGRTTVDFVGRKRGRCRQPHETQHRQHCENNSSSHGSSLKKR